MDWMSKDEAKNYFGAVTDEELEEIVADNDLDVELDDEDNIVLVGALQAKEALFKEHEKKFGVRPDDYRAMEKAQKEHDKQEEQEQGQSQLAKSKLKMKLGRHE